MLKDRSLEIGLGTTAPYKCKDIHLPSHSYHGRFLGMKGFKETLPSSVSCLMILDRVTFRFKKALCDCVSDPSLFDSKDGETQ